MKAIIAKFTLLLSLTIPAVYADMNSCAVHPKLYPRSTDNLLVLDVSQCHLSDADMPILLNNLQSMGVSITEIKMNNNNITDAGVKLLLKFPLTGSVAIDLSSNKLTDASTFTLAAIPNLQTLKLDFNSIRDAGADTLLFSKSMQILSLAHTKIDVLGVERLAKDDYLESLDVSYNSLGKQCITNINDNLKILNLQATHQPSFPCGHNTMCHHRNLISLDLSDNDFRDAWKCDEGKYKLKVLYYRNNNVDIENFKYMLLMSDFKELESIDLTGNHLTDQNIEEFSKAIPTLRTLNLSNNQIGSVGAISLSKNGNYTNLNLQNNHIADTGAIALATQKYTYLNLENNQIGQLGLDILQQARNSGAISNLDVAGNPGAKNN